jgi:hypothetical protein
MKLDMGSAAVGASAGFEAVIGAREVKWYKGHYLKLNALLVCIYKYRIERIKLTSKSFFWS